MDSGGSIGAAVHVPAQVQRATDRKEVDRPAGSDATTGKKLPAVAPDSAASPAATEASPLARAAAVAAEVSGSEEPIALNDRRLAVQREIRFSEDESSGRRIVTVLDRDTGEVVRQLPSEVALRLARFLDSQGGADAQLDSGLDLEA